MSLKIKALPSEKESTTTTYQILIIYASNETFMRTNLVVPREILISSFIPISLRKIVSYKVASARKFSLLGIFDLVEKFWRRRDII